MKPPRSQEARVEPSEREDEIARKIVNSSIKVHKALGPGLLESAYQRCLCYQLSKDGMGVRPSVRLPVHYEEVVIHEGYVIDVLVEDCIILELKAVEGILPVHEAQLFTYLRLANIRLGFLLNFHVPLMKNGIKRFINSRFDVSAPPLSAILQNRTPLG